MDYEVIIGMEVHVQLQTKSKMFCRCSADYAAAEANTHTCPICTGMPGVLPSINSRAVELTVMTGLALDCHINDFSRFARKSYFYPDLPKNYQISQYELPLCEGGCLNIRVDGGEKCIRIRRIHLEEDTAKLTHVGEHSLIDFNRSGVPLMEIVTEPDLRTAREAHEYLVRLRSILRYLGVSSGNMEEGAMRCEANVSLKPVGDREFGTKVEVKNLNSFRAVEQALEYEIERQTVLLSAGGRVQQVTMGWDDVRGVTVVQRTKEEAHDYRYFPEPDLPPLCLSDAYFEGLRANLPELPDKKRARFQEQYGLSLYDAALLTADRAVAEFFEAATRAHGDAKAVANWISGELFRLLKLEEKSIEDLSFGPDALAGLLTLVDQGAINQSTAKEVLEIMFRTGQDAKAVVAERGLLQISDMGALARVVVQVVSDNPKPVADYRAGRQAAIGFLMGLVMKATRGKANQAVARQLLEERLKGLD